MAFMGMNMAGQAGGMNAQNLYQMAHSSKQRSLLRLRQLLKDGTVRVDRAVLPENSARTVAVKSRNQSLPPKAGNARSAARRQPENSARKRPKAGIAGKRLDV